MINPLCNIYLICYLIKIVHTHYEPMFKYPVTHAHVDPTKFLNCDDLHSVQVVAVPEHFLHIGSHSVIYK